MTCPGSPGGPAGQWGVYGVTTNGGKKWKYELGEGALQYGIL